MRDSIQPYIDRRVVVLNQNLPAAVAARALHERGVGSAVVNDKNGHMVGIVTDRDLSSQILGFGLPADTPISEVMAVDILKVGKTSTIADVAKVMEVNGIRRVPVIEKTENGREKCIGIVTLDDLIASHSVDPKLLSRIVKSQIFRQVRRIHTANRSEDRKDQTLNRFNKAMADQMNVPKPMAERMAFHLLKEIVQRLTSTGAAHFIAQLPSLLHEDLLDLPAGPNLQINENTIIENMMKGFQLDEFVTLGITKGFWRALEITLDPGILDHILAQMPRELREIFCDRAVTVETVQMEFGYAHS